jgi:electron transfer flavoprotein beta subunit
MNIAVCIKRVIDMETRFKIAPDGRSIDEAGAKFDMSDFDLYAVEAALQLKEKAGAGEVVAVSIGPLVVQETIRKALSMGVDRGLHLAADAVPFDDSLVARALAAGLSGRAFDLILFGRMAVDSANQAVGPMTAQYLGLPCVTAVSGLDIADDRGTAKREIEGAAEIVSFPLPAVVTIDEGLNTPRLPNLKGIMAAKKKPLESVPAAFGESRVRVEKMELPEERPAGRIIGEGVAAVPDLIRLLHTEAKVL